MKNSSPPNHLVTLGRAKIHCWMLLGMLPMLVSCSWLFHTPRKPVSNAPIAAPSTTSEDVLKVYLQTMAALISNDPARQSDVFYEVEREYKKAPTTAARLRYALALVTPNHAGTKPSEGKRILEALLNDPERLAPPERTFADILFSQVAARLKLENDDRRLIATLEERARTQASSDKRTIAQQVDEIARLKRALADAEQKLDAIKEIERSLIERSPTPPGNRDNASETQSTSPGR